MRLPQKSHFGTGRIVYEHVFAAQAQEATRPAGRVAPDTLILKKAPSGE
jgi:hypothetical protein